MFKNLVTEIFPEDSKNINVLHLIDGLLRGLDVNFENDKWYLKIKNKCSPSRKKLDWGNITLTKAKLKMAIETNLKPLFPNQFNSIGEFSEIDDIKEK